MMEANDDVEFGDVEVLDHDGLMLWCRIAGRVVAVPPLRVLSGTQVRVTGDGESSSCPARSQRISA